MAKYAHQDVLEKGLQEVVDNADGYYACSQQPTTYDEATNTYALAHTNVASTDFSWASGSTGMELTIAAKSGISIDADGDLTHVALVDSATSRLLIVDTTSIQHLYAGNQLNLPSWKMISKNPV